MVLLLVAGTTPEPDRLHTAQATTCISIAMRDRKCPI